MNQQTPLIALSGLTKRYGRTVAVRDLSLDVYADETFGFLGLNGAGKTTTIRILLDLVRPTAGRATVLGHDCQRSGMSVRAAVGYLPGEITFYPDMTGWQVLTLLEKLSAGRVSCDHRRRLLDRFQLAEADLRRRIREYSTGMKRKLGLVQAFQHEPELLILDEPTEGLDPLMQEAFYDVLTEVRSRGCTVFMSSHVLSEVERVCSRIAILRAGRLAVVRPVDELRHLAPRRVLVTFDQPVAIPADAMMPPGASLTRAEPRRWALTLHGPLGPLVQRLSSLPVADMTVEDPKLEDVVIEYYREGVQ